MRMSYDKEVDAAYVYFKDHIGKGEVAKAVPVTEDIIVDFDKDQKLLGLEILRASFYLPRVSLSDSISKEIAQKA